MHASVRAGSAAEKAQIATGDRIVGVNGTNVVMLGLDCEQVAALVSGVLGSTVRLELVWCSACCSACCSASCSACCSAWYSACCSACCSVCCSEQAAALVSDVLGSTMRLELMCLLCMTCLEFT